MCATWCKIWMGMGLTRVGGADLAWHRLPAALSDGSQSDLCHCTGDPGSPHWRTFDQPTGGHPQLCENGRACDLEQLIPFDIGERRLGGSPRGCPRMTNGGQDGVIDRMTPMFSIVQGRTGLVKKQHRLGPLLAQSRDRCRNYLLRGCPQSPRMHLWVSRIKISQK
jgi:hypothetical protein